MFLFFKEASVVTPDYFAKSFFFSEIFIGFYQLKELYVFLHLYRFSQK